MTANDNPVVNFDVDDVCRRFEVIYTGAIADVLDEMGYRNQVLPHEIQGLTLATSVTGVAMTVEGEPFGEMERDAFFIPFLQMLGDLKRGDVIVSQPHDSNSAHLGELSCETAKFRGARGAVIDGGARDIDYTLKLGFSVFCRYRTPRDILGRWRLVSYGQPIEIGGVAIRRRDFITGDKDGVLVIPQEITLQVLERAEAVVSTEDLVRKAILEGVHPVDAYRKHDRF